MSQERADVWLAAWEAHAADAQIARDGAYWDSAVDWITAQRRVRSTPA